MIIRISGYVALLAVLSLVAGDPCEAFCSMQDPPIRPHGCCAASSQRLQPSCCQEGATHQAVASLVVSLANVPPETGSLPQPDAVGRGIGALSFRHSRPHRPLAVLRI
jgi:hypothetical protein